MRRFASKCLLVFCAISATIMPSALYAENFRFAVLGDTQGQLYLDDIVSAIQTESVDFVLICGDLTENGTSIQLDNWINKMQPLYDAGIGVYPIRGNHDSRTSKSIWDSFFGSDPNYILPDNGPAGEEYATYAFTHKNVFVVGLDNYVKPRRINQKWLDKQFEANTQPHVFVFGHEPAFRLYHTMTQSKYPRDRDLFWNSLTTEGGRVYFCGHDHHYDHIRLDNADSDTGNDLHQFILNSSHKMYLDWLYNGNNGSWEPYRIFHEEAFGYLLVEINNLDVTISWKSKTSLINPSYQTTDAFSYIAVPFDTPKITILDPHLKAAISSELGVQDPNTLDMLKLTNLNADSLGISDLSGLEYAKNITDLNLNNNFIKGTSVLTYLSNLESLHLLNNPLERTFYCIDLHNIISNNQDIVIEYSPNPIINDDCVVAFTDPVLEMAVESTLGLTDPNLINMLSLIELHSNSSSITELSGLEYAYNIEFLELNDNQINDLSPISGHIRLEQLSLSDNQLTEISVLDSLTDLWGIYLDRNFIADISPLLELNNIWFLELRSNPLNTSAYCIHIPYINSYLHSEGHIYYDTINPNPLTDDCLTNITELMVFVSNWLDVGCNISNNWCAGADLNHVDDVDLADFAELASYWLD